MLGQPNKNPENQIEQLLQRLNEPKFKNRLDALEEDVALLKEIVTALNKEVAELKKAI